MSSFATKLRAAADALAAEVDELEKEVERLQYIKATIRVNAMKHGASEEQIERFLTGEESFIGWMVKVVEKQGGPKG